MKNEVEHTINYIKEISEKVGKLENELNEKDKIIKNQKEEITLKKEELKRRNYMSLFCNDSIHLNR